MPAPYLGNVINGWTEPIVISIETVTVVNFRKTSTISTETIHGNLQPMPPEQIQRKLEEQWSWKWWSLIVKGSTSLKTDDFFAVGTKRFRVSKLTDWTRSGFTKIEAIEDYQEAST